MYGNNNISTFFDQDVLEREMLIKEISKIFILEEKINIIYCNNFYKFEVLGDS